MTGPGEIDRCFQKYRPPPTHHLPPTWARMLDLPAKHRIINNMHIYRMARVFAFVPESADVPDRLSMPHEMVLSFRTKGESVA